MDFKIFTNALKAYESEDGDLHVSGTTSSSIKDLHGDEMSLDALKEMQRTAAENMTVFLNHNYNVPEDLFGSVRDARIVKRYDAATGQEVYDLDIDVRVVGEDENPEAMRAYRAIKRGVKLGLSIGARVEKASRKTNKDSGEESILIEKVRLMEASVVGIPANQRSYLQNAIKSIKAAGVNLSEISGDEDYAETFNSKLAKAREIIDSIKSVEIEGQPSAENEQLAATLAGVLADAAALYVKAHGAHWNVVGLDFAQYHELFGEIYEDVFSSLDPLAENIRKLNVPAPAEIRELALLSSSQPVADDYDPESLASSVYAANEALIARIVAAFDIATKLNQQGIANFLAERQDMHQKWSWQLRSSLAEEEADTGEGGVDTEDTTTEKASRPIGLGDFVSYRQVEGANGVGEVEQVLRSGSVTVPKSNEEIPATASDPAVLIRIWVKSGDNWKPSNDFLGFKGSQLKKVKKLVGGNKQKPTATTVPGLEIIEPGKSPKEQEKSMDIEEKKTRVTVTVSTDSNETQPAAASVAPSAPEAVATEADEIDEVKASASPDDVEVQAEEISEPEAEPEAEPEVDPSVVALEALGAKLVGADEDGKKSLLQALDALIKGASDDTSAQPEVAEAEINAEVAPVAAEAQEDVEADTASIGEVESIAKSALDAANAAQEEVTALAAKVTELSEAKAKVEQDLTKAFDLIDRISELGVGRKPVDHQTQRVNVKSAENAPWLSPYVQRVLEAHEEK